MPLPCSLAVLSRVYDSAASAAAAAVGLFSSVCLCEYVCVCARAHCRGRRAAVCLFAFQCLPFRKTPSGGCCAAAALPVNLLIKAKATAAVAEAEAATVTATEQQQLPASN